MLAPWHFGLLGSVLFLLWRISVYFEVVGWLVRLGQISETFRQRFLASRDFGDEMEDNANEGIFDKLWNGLGAVAFSYFLHKVMKSEEMASLVDVLWHLRRVEESCALLERQLERQAAQEDVGAMILAQGHAALAALHKRVAQRAT